MANEDPLAQLKQRVAAWNQWRKGRYSVLRQRCASAFQRAWGRAAPAGSRGLQTIKDTSQKTFAHLQTVPWRVLALRYRPLLVGFLGLLLLLAIWKVPQWQAARWKGQIEPKELAKQESDTRTTVVQAIGGAVVLIGLWFTWRNMRLTEKNIQITQETALRNFETTREGQITDRFTKAIGQLGEVGLDKLAIRLGGIYALERIARDSERDHWPIMEILTAYVRENASWKEGEHPSQEDIALSETQPTQSNQLPPKLASDIQAILTVLGRRTHTWEKEANQRLNLGNTDLRGANLQGAHLEKANLYRAQLQGATFYRAQLQGAYLHEAQLQGAALYRAHLEEANLYEAQLQGANLEGAHLEVAYLYAPVST
jgi:hypothetical protein